jgi:hypothetical protein
MLGFLQRDLTAVGEALEILQSEVAEYAALCEHLQAEAARIARRDGCPIAPDDPNSYRAGERPRWRRGPLGGRGAHDPERTQRERVAPPPQARGVRSRPFSRSPSFGRKMRTGNPPRVDVYLAAYPLDGPPELLTGKRRQRDLRGRARSPWRARASERGDEAA